MQTPQKVGEVVHDGETLTVMKAQYSDNGALCILILAANGEPYAKLSTNLHQEDLVEGTLNAEPDEIYVRFSGSDYMFELYDDLLKSGMFKNTGKTVQYGRGVYGHVWKVLV